MQSSVVKEELMNIWQGSVKSCRKNGSYKFYGSKRFRKEHTFMAFLEGLPPFSLVPYTVYKNALPGDLKIETVLPGDKEPEQVFKVADTKDRVLVKGAVGELYHAKLAANFEIDERVKHALEGPIGYKPIKQIRQYLLVTDRVFETLCKIVKNKAKNPAFVRVPTSWGASHYVSKGDYLIIDSNGVYRIQKDVFLKTYVANNA